MSGARLDWPQLWALIRPRLTLKDGKVDADGWIWARCIFPGNHTNGDKDASMHINVRTGGVTCMACDFKGKNLNDLADALNVDATDPAKAEPTPISSGRPTAKSRTPSLQELADARMLPVEVLKFNGVTSASGGWAIAMDDPDARGASRYKGLPGARPKYWWAPAKTVKAQDCVYGLTRIPSSVESVLICAGEPDRWVLTLAGHHAISFLAGEGALPTDRAIVKVKAALPHLKNVVIVYDRDAAGESGAKQLADLFLKDGDVTVDLCKLPDTLPLKGDVTDLWKLCGGVKEAFNEAFDAVLISTEHFEPVAPRVSEIDFNHYRVELPVVSQGGRIEFDFLNMETKGRELSAEITARLIDMPGFPKREFSPTNVNFKSTGGRESVFKALERTYGAAFEWEDKLLEAMDMARVAYTGSTPGIDLFDAVEEDVTYRIGDETRGFLPDGKPACLFGDGGVSKTQVGLSALIAIAYGHKWQGMDTIQGPVMMVDAEASEGQIRNRAKRQLEAMGLGLDRRLIHYWPARGRPLADMAESLRTYVRKHGIVYMLLDSVTLLCNGEPEKADMARVYFQALGYIGIGSLSIAHVSLETGKSSNQTKPFGSSFWHNSSRMTWNAQKAPSEAQRTLNVALHCRKANDDELMPSMGLQVRYDGRHGPISLIAQNLMDVPDFADKQPLPKRIRYSLAQSFKTEQELTQELFADIAQKTMSPDEEVKAWQRAAAQVRARLADLKKANVVFHSGADNRWCLVPNREEVAS